MKPVEIVTVKPLSPAVERLNKRKTHAAQTMHTPVLLIGFGCVAVLMVASWLGWVLR